MLHLTVAAFAASQGKVNDLGVNCFDHSYCLQSRVSSLFAILDGFDTRSKRHLASTSVILSATCMKTVSTLLLLVFAASMATAQTREIRINLVDPAGAAVTDASVQAASAKAELKPCAIDDHAFICTVADSGGVRFEIAAKGFKPLKLEYAEKDVTCCEYVFVLQIEPVTN